MRSFIVALAGLLCALAAQAQTRLPDERSAQLIGCLTSGDGEGGAG